MMKKILIPVMLGMALLQGCKQEEVAKNQNKTALAGNSELSGAIMAEPNRYLLLAEQSQNRISVVNATDGTFFWNWKAGVNNNVSAANEV